MVKNNVWHLTMKWKSARRGWCLGWLEFKAELLERMEGNLGEHHSGELRRESEQARAKRSSSEELKPKLEFDTIF